MGLLRARLLLLLLPESKQGDSRHLYDLELDTGNVSLRAPLVAEAGNKHLVVHLDKVQAAVVGDEGGDFFGVLDKLHTDGLADGRVWLLRLDTPRKSKRGRIRGCKEDGRKTAVFRDNLFPA